jgi:hypothetical protein
VNVAGVVDDLDVIDIDDIDVNVVKPSKENVALGNKGASINPDIEEGEAMPEVTEIKKFNNFLEIEPKLTFELT